MLTDYGEWYCDECLEQKDYCQMVFVEQQELCDECYVKEE